MHIRLWLRRSYLLGLLACGQALGAVTVINNTSHSITPGYDLKVPGGSFGSGTCGCGGCYLTGTAIPAGGSGTYALQGWVSMGSQLAFVDMNRNFTSADGAVYGGPTVGCADYITADGIITYNGQDFTITYGQGTTCRTIYFVNMDSVPRSFTVYSNNLVSGSLLNPPQVDFVSLNPGQVYQKSITGPDSFRLWACRKPIAQEANTGCDATIFDVPCQSTPPLTGAGAGANTNTPAAPVYDGSLTNIQWAGATNPATDGSVRSGFSALYDEGSKVGTLLDSDLKKLLSAENPLHGDLNAINNGLSGLDADIIRGFNGNSNLLGQMNQNLVNGQNGISNLLNGGRDPWPSNTFGLLTNSYGQVTNRQSGAMASMFAATNGASQLSLGGLVAAGQGALDQWGEAELNNSSPSADLKFGTAGKSATMTITLTPLSSSWVPIGYNVIKWSCYLWLFIANYMVFREAVSRCMLAPQARTAGEEVLGNNVNFASALIVAALIVAAVGVLVAAFIPGLITALSHVVGSNIPFNDLAGTTAWVWVANVMPIGVVIGVLGSHLLLRMTCDSAALVVMGVIKFLVGL